MTLNAFDPDRVKHLEFIQGVISRQAGNSFLIKGWSVTISGAIYGFAINGINWKLALFGLAPALIFWCLDGYYLWQERLFRCLYHDVSISPDVPRFSMSTEAYKKNERWLSAIRRYTVWPLYLSIIAGGIVTAVLAASQQHPHH
jgi:hypothetical protein